MLRVIDHLVYCVPDLDRSIETLQTQLGIEINKGGKHTSQGTKNALINLGNNCYLEILAVDEASNIEAPRWMGIDLIDQPTLTRWSIKTTNIDIDSPLITSYDNNLGQVSESSRMMSNGKMLNWKMTMPLAQPSIEIVPFITDWSHSDIHPTDNLPEQCSLNSLEFFHPTPTKIQKLFDQLGIDFTIESSTSIAMKAVIHSPNGMVELS